MPQETENIIKQREAGYYWVKRMEIWYIAEWDNGFWYLISDSRHLTDDYFEEIDEKRLTHE